MWHVRGGRCDEAKDESIGAIEMRRDRVSKIMGMEVKSSG
jgi:hypothetical protein